MKPRTLRRAAFALALAGSAILTGCGSNSGGAPAVPGAAAIAGGVYSTVGGSCVPITSPIGFTVSGMSATQVDATDAEYTFGTIPGGTAVGSGTLYTGAPPTGTVGPTYTSSGVSGSFAIQVANTTTPTMPYGYSYGYYSGTSLTATGVISIGPTMLQQIANYVGMGGLNGTSTIFPTYGGYTGSPYTSIPGYNYSGTYSSSTLCVSGIAVQGYLYEEPTVMGANAEIFLYLDNTQHGYILQFY